MADLTTEFCGIRSPNPFWVASGPPSNTAAQAHRAFEAGWGGLVWKTIGEPIVNTSSRYASLDLPGSPMAGFTNIELISDRSPETNFRELKEVKDRWPERALIASLMTDTREQWRDFVRRSEDAGADGLELNFGCPHGMCERGMGSAVGQNPDVIETITGWVTDVADVPVIVKLTPNITDITQAARAAVRGGADAVSLINTVTSIISVDLDTFAPRPSVDGLGTHGGYCGPAVRPIALHMVRSCATDPEVPVPVCGIGGITTWRDAAEFLVLGATSLQVCTAIMRYGFRIVSGLTEGLSRFLDEKGLVSVEALVGQGLSRVRPWEELNLHYHRVARINPDRCIACNLCHIACEDGAHQCIDLVPPESSAPPVGRIPGKPIPRVREDDCVGCNLCALVCPVDGCIDMLDVDRGPPPLTWAGYQQQLAAGEIGPIPPKP